MKNLSPRSSRPANGRAGLCFASRSVAGVAQLGNPWRRPARLVPARNRTPVHREARQRKVPICSLALPCLASQSEASNGTATHRGASQSKVSISRGQSWSCTASPGGASRRVPELCSANQGNVSLFVPGFGLALPPSARPGSARKGKEAAALHCIALLVGAWQSSAWQSKV